MINIIKKLEGFPPFRSSVQQLLQKVENDESTTEEIAATIASDTGIAAMVLKLANSPFYGVSRQVVSITEACVLIGRFSLKNILLSLSIGNFIESSNIKVINCQALWQESLLTACIAKEVSENSDINKELALTTGIIHKIGKLALAWADPERYQQVVDYQNKFETSDIEAEQPLLNHNHAEIGGMILESWLMPDEVITAVRRYPYQFEKPDNELAALIALSGILAQWCLTLEASNDEKGLEDKLEHFDLTKFGCPKLLDYLQVAEVDLRPYLMRANSNFKLLKMG